MTYLDSNELASLCNTTKTNSIIVSVTIIIITIVEVLIIIIIMIIITINYQTEIKAIRI